MKKLPKIIVIIGAQPDIGKGIFTASCTYLLQERGFSTNPLKFDGYLNYNSGTINRYHDKVASSYFNEEVFVLKDGFETDVDSGYYERFLNREFDTTSVLTNGMIIKEIIALENKKGYPMGTILKFSDIRKLILRWFMKTAEKSEIIGLEIGGTIGDPESKIVYEALDLIKQTKRANIITLMLAPYLPSRSENNKKYDFSLSSKTIRKSFLLAWKNNLKPDGIIIRCKEKNMNQRDLDYILSDCYLSDKDIFFDYDCKSIYDLPEILTRQHFTEYIINKFNLSTKKNKKTKSIETYSLKLNKLKSNKGRLIKLGIFGKTVSYDSFISLIEAIEHAMVFLGIKVDIIWLDDSKNFKKELNNIDCLIIGEGTNFKKEKIEAIRFAKNNNTPILAISFGFNLAVMESLGISVEREKEVFSFIDNIEKGEIKVNIKKGTLAEQIYKNENNVYERNRYDSYLKPQFVKDLKSKGIILSGVEKRGRISIMELPRSPFYLAVKFHPEFKSRPNCPHPIFVKLLKIAILKNERKF